MEMGMKNFRKIKFTPPPPPYNQELESKQTDKHILKKKTNQPGGRNSTSQVAEIAKKIKKTKLWNTKNQLRK